MDISKQFRAGVAQVDITPFLGTRINGDFVTHYASVIHDPLFSRALILDDGDISIAIIIVDICAMQKDFLDPIKTEIESQLGINPKNILISSTHTHSGGSVTDLLLGGVDMLYRERLPKLIIESAIQAYRNLQNAKVGYGRVNAPEHVVCRRYFMKEGYEARNPLNNQLDMVKTNPFGDEEFIESRASKVDDEVAYLAIKNDKNEFIGILANYSLHYVGDFGSGIISADYFGVFSKHLANQLGNPKGFVGFMSNGTSGEANIWDFMDPERYPKEPFGKSEFIGKALAKKVYASIDKINWQDNSKLSVHYKEIKLLIRKPSESELNTALKVVSTANFENILPNQEGLQSIYAREQVLLHEYADYTLLPIQSIKIGDITIGAIGAELFAETGIALKNAVSNKKYFTICMANDYIGYVPPELEFSLGGYETWRCRTSQLVIDAENQIRNKLTSMNLISP